LLTWETYIPAGGLTILAGPPGVGKTFLALAMAVAVSHDRAVILLTNEADLGCIVRPRLDVLSANLANVFCADTSKCRNEAQAVEWLNADMGALIREKQAGLVIVDSVEGFVNGRATRRALARMAELAREWGIPFLAVTAVPGGVRAMAHSVLRLHRDGAKRVMKQTHSSVGPRGPAQAFVITDAGRMEWAAV